MSCVKTARNRAKKNILWDCHGMLNFTGGWGGIRTPGSLTTSAVFKTVAFDRSATHPKLFFDGSFKPAVLVMRKLSFALTSLRSQDRRIRPRLSPVLNFSGILYVSIKNVKLYLITSYNMFPILF